MLDVESPLSEIENLQDQRKKRDAAKHHRRNVASQGIQKQFSLTSVLPDFFDNLPLEPFFERRLRVTFLADREMRFVLRMWAGANCGGRRLIRRNGRDRRVRR